MSAVRHYGFAHFHQDTQLPLSKGATNNRVFLHQMEVTVYIAPLERKLMWGVRTALITVASLEYFYKSILS